MTPLSYSPSSKVLSERAALSRPAVELVTALAVALGREFSDRLQRLYVPPLLDLIRRTNNIVREVRGPAQ